MVCGCDRCMVHLRTLGIDEMPQSADVIKEAYRDSVKVWHPDRFEGDSRLRAKAEEQFKRVQVAFRELTEHGSKQGVKGCEAESREREVAPSVPFGNFKGCLSATEIPTGLDRRIKKQTGMKVGEKILGIVDLSHTTDKPGDYSKFLLLTNRGIWVNDTFTSTVFLSYRDLGQVRLIDHQNLDRKLGWWKRQVERASGTNQKTSLEISKRDGSHFFTLSAPADDSIKAVVNNFLLGS